MTTPTQTELLRDPWAVDQIRKLEHEGLRAGLPLMQRAADCAVEFILREGLCPQAALILAGPGNNGGDAITVALRLLEEGRRVTLIMPVAPEEQATDARIAFERWQRSGHRILTFWPTTLPPVDLIVDGLFGIGLNRALQPPWSTLVDQANACPTPILALDVPSGLDAQSGAPLGNAAIQAQWTVSFIAPTTGICLPQAHPWVGKSYVCTLGLR